MSMQFSLGKGVIRAVISLGFLGCLMAQGSLLARSAASEPFTATTEVSADASGLTTDDSRYPNPSAREGEALAFNEADSLMEIGMPDEFSVAVEDEDSIEMFRFDIQERAFSLDRTVIGLKVISKVAQATRPNISSPLVV
jgi:hypothetical protein